MSDLTGLKTSILEQSHDKGRQNLEAAKKKLEADFEQKKAQLLLEKEAQRSSQLGEIKRRFQKEMQQLENQARQSTLAAKQTVLEELFAAAAADMKAWSQEKHLAFFRSVMASYQDKITVRFGQETADKLSEESWSELAIAFPNIDFDKEAIAHQAGFLITAGQVDDNFLYNNLLTELWETESFRLASEIFQPE